MTYFFKLKPLSDKGANIVRCPFGGLIDKKNSVNKFRGWRHKLGLGRRIFYLFYDLINLKTFVDHVIKFKLKPRRVSHLEELPNFTLEKSGRPLQDIQGLLFFPDAKTCPPPIWVRRTLTCVMVTKPRHPDPSLFQNELFPSIPRFRTLSLHCSS